MWSAWFLCGQRLQWWWTQNSGINDIANLLSKHVGAKTFILPSRGQFGRTCEYDENDTRAQAFTYTHTHTLQLNPINAQFHQRDRSYRLQEHSAPSLFWTHVNETCHFASFASFTFACTVVLAHFRLESIAWDLPPHKIRLGSFARERSSGPRSHWYIKINCYNGKILN